MNGMKGTIEEGEDFLRHRVGVLEFSLIGSAMFLPEEACQDVDFAVLTAGGAREDFLRLVGEGWEDCAEQYDLQDGTWGSVRRGDINLMITSDKAWYDRYKLAMEVCKALRLTEKKDRIAVCRVVRDGWAAEAVWDKVNQTEES